jgi:type IV pilus assembly protein PilN
MPRINLLPWRAERRKKNQRDFAVWTMGAVGAAIGVTLVLNLIMSGQISAQNRKNELLNTEIQELDKQITEILGLEAQRERMKSRMEIIQTLQRSRPEVVHLFDQLVRTLPDGVFLTSVKQTEKRLELKGMRNLDASDWMDNPELEVVETKKDSALGSEFTLFANQVGVTLPGAEEQQP